LRVAEIAERLIDEADAVRGQAEHHEEQGDRGHAQDFFRIEYGLRIMAHVFAAVHVEELEDE
jgi:hypothetical protein